MNKIVEETIKNMILLGERNGEDYIGEDGLLYCGQCHEPKEVYFNQEKVGLHKKNQHKGTTAEKKCKKYRL